MDHFSADQTSGHLLRPVLVQDNSFTSQYPTSGVFDMVSQRAPWHRYLTHCCVSYSTCCFLWHRSKHSCGTPLKLLCVPCKIYNRSHTQPRDGKVTPNSRDTSKHHHTAISNDLQSWNLKFAPCMAPVRVPRLQCCSARLWRVNKSICWSPVVCVWVCLCGSERDKSTPGEES